MPFEQNAKLQTIDRTNWRLSFALFTSRFECRKSFQITCMIECVHVYECAGRFCCCCCINFVSTFVPFSFHRSNSLPLSLQLAFCFNRSRSRSHSDTEFVTSLCFGHVQRRHMLRIALHISTGGTYLAKFSSHVILIDCSALAVSFFYLHRAANSCHQIDQYRLLLVYIFVLVL